MCEKFDEAIAGVVQPIKEKLLNICLAVKPSIFEVRLRANKPIIINVKNEFLFLNRASKLQNYLNSSTLIIPQEDIKNTFNNMCNHSVYSYQNQIKNGFITLKGGHRVGICGAAVLNKEGVANLRDISSLNIRIAHSVTKLKNDWETVLSKNFTGVLIVGEPASGKTTLLRNLGRMLSDGSSGAIKNVSVIDERNEISGTNCGVSQFNLGFCDVLTGYPKNIGFEHAIRTLSPEVIICDEIGSKDDIKSIKQAVNSGVKIIATFHGGGIYDLINNIRAKAILKTGAFDKIIVLKGKANPGEILKIYRMEDLKDEICRSNNVGNFVGSNGIFSIA